MHNGATAPPRPSGVDDAFRAFAARAASVADGPAYWFLNSLNIVMTTAPSLIKNNKDGTAFRNRRIRYVTRSLETANLAFPHLQQRSAMRRSYRR